MLLKKNSGLLRKEQSALCVVEQDLCVRVRQMC